MRLPSPETNTVWNVAHRGASGRFPENTLRAFDQALSDGCDAIELDVQLSRDEVPVVYHDRTLARSGGGRRRVCQLDYDSLRRLNVAARFPGAGRAQRMPSLEQVLRRYGSRTRLLIEIKLREGRHPSRRDSLLLQRVVDLVRQLGLQRSVALLCFEIGILEQARELAPGLTRILNVTPRPTLGKKLRAQLEMLDGVSADIRTLSTRFGRALALADRPLLVFTCNSARRLELALRAGAVAIMSDRPDWLSLHLPVRASQR